MNKKKEFRKLITLTKKYLKQEKERGVELIKKPKHTATAVKSAVKNAPADKKQQLEQLSLEASHCTKCNLSKTRIKVVFGQGNPSARLMFIGEGPGYDEDRQGMPFVGRAGQLLTSIINAMHLKREDVYIANIVKCHPLKDATNIESRGNDRAPDPEETNACFPFLIKQIEIIKPEVIVTLGAPSTRTLLGMSGDPEYNNKVSISAVRGKFFDFKGIKLLPTFHPAFLLRDPNQKKFVWEDMQKVMKLLNI